ncbi:MAG: hypothetical protein V4603_01785 [Pseudomonadota bacterium]
MKRVKSNVSGLSSRLQANLLALNGNIPTPTRRVGWQLIVPVAVVVGAAVLFSLSPKARKSLLLQMLVLGSTRLLRASANVNGHMLDS